VSPFSVLTRGLQKLLPGKPPIRGERRLPGLHSDVHVSYTAGGVPHIVASSAPDLFFAQGYITAADRLFQMDLTRRTARGELAEIFGSQPTPWRELTVVFREKSIVDLDHFMRQLSLGAAAREAAETLPPETLSLVEAYAAGVNAFIEEGARPLECQLLGYTPRPWTTRDAAVLWKALAFQLSYGWRAGLAAEALRARFPSDAAKARALVPDQRDVQDVMLPLWTGAAGALGRIENIAGKAGPGGSSLGGSNAWAVAPSRTKHGRAILCGDPHLPLRAPSAGYLVQLSGGGYDVTGWSIPGVPGVVMGHNAHVAWSITAGCTQEATWAMEQFSADGDQVRTANGFAPIESESTEIFVRGEKKPVQRRVRHTGNGPLFEGSLLGEAPAGFGLALRWTGHLPTPDLHAVLELDRVRDFASLRTAAGKMGSPQVNVVYADAAGHIGWQLVGVSPRFKGRPPLSAVPGWSAAHEWDGIEPFESMPYLFDPPEGFIVSANQRLAPDGATLQLGELFEPPYRARRIRARLESAPHLTLDDAAAIQLDRFSGFGVELRDRFIVPLSRRLKLEGPAADVLALAAGWSGFAEPESAGAAALWSFVTILARELFEPVLGDRLFHAVFEQQNLPLMPLLRVLANDGQPFVTRDALDVLAKQALEQAAAQLTKLCHGPAKRWRLDGLRTVSLRHPFSDVPAIGALFTVGPVPWGGDGSTVNNATSRLSGEGATEIGPVFRQAVECGDWDGYRAVMAGGQGGDPTTGRYRELFDLWARGELLSVPFSPDAVARASSTRAVLHPKSAG
jgi:penicillin amidase